MRFATRIYMTIGAMAIGLIVGLMFGVPSLFLALVPFLALGIVGAILPENAMGMRIEKIVDFLIVLFAAMAIAAVYL